MSKNTAKGMIVSEVMLTIVLVAVIAAVALGIYVSHERDNRMQDAKASIVLVKAKAARVDASQQVACDESFVAASVLANDFVSLTIVAVPIKVNGLTKGFGPGIHISSSRETDGNDSFVTSDRLFKALKDEDRGSLRSIVAEDDDIKFTVLASNMPICIDPLTQMTSEAISPPVDETLVSPTGAAGTDLDTSV